MPEGPEVKIASSYFNSYFKSCKKIEFEILTNYYQEKYGEIFKKINSEIDLYPQSYTVGKNIFIDLKNDLIFNFHLGMTGGWCEKNVKHCHFRIFSESKELFYKDVRKFGKMKLITKNDFLKKFNFNYDLLNNNYNFKDHIKHLNNKIRPNKSICKILMDQLLFPGVGNYIKSEVLYEAKLHPEEVWGKISEKEKKTLIAIAKNIMKESYYTGGAELRDFKNPFHVSEFKLKVYGRKNTDNNNEISSITTSDNRKTWYCKKIQILKK